MHFEWDEEKNRINQTKHGISFQEASTAFLDERAILFDDPEHSEREDRFVLIGLTETLRICTVCHCYRSEDEIIRIISARRATRKEVEQYVRGI